MKSHGGKRQGSGRKPKPRKVSITVRMTPEQRQSVNRSAKACGVSAEAWVRARLFFNDEPATVHVSPNAMMARKLFAERMEPDIGEAVKKAFEDIPRSLW